jgi:hypothetical protein
MAVVFRRSFRNGCLETHLLTSIQPLLPGQHVDELSLVQVEHGAGRGSVGDSGPRRAQPALST